jgi:hypothetical protein
MTRTQLLGGLILAALVLPTGGCSKRSKLYKVEGTITYDGKPLEGAEIKFYREDGSGIPATAVSGSGGEFRLTTFTTGDGAMEGNYKATVTVPGHEMDQSFQMPEDAKGRSEAMEKLMKTPKKKDPKKVEIPASYGDPGKTNLKYVVPPADGSGKINIDLRKSGT